MEERKPEPEVRQFKKEILANRPAMLMIGGYTAHTWELEAQRAWTPAFMIACFLAQGSTREDAIQSGSTFSSTMYVMGVFSTMIAGYLSDRWGRTAIIAAIMTVSVTCSFSFGWMIAARCSGSWRWGCAMGFR